MKTKTKIKTKPSPRARKMWANYYSQNFLPALHQSKKSAIQCCGPSVEHRAIPVAVIPVHDPEALVDAAVTSHSHSYCGIATRRQAMRAALTAIGVLPKSKGGRK